MYAELFVELGHETTKVGSDDQDFAVMGPVDLFWRKLLEKIQSRLDCDTAVAPLHSLHKRTVMRGIPIHREH